MSKRDEFPKKVKLAMWERCNGRRECGCGVKIIGTPIYDHYPVPAAHGGPGTIENGRVLDPKCNHRITYQTDVPAIKKATRTFENRIGARTKSGGFRKAPLGMKFDWSQRRYVRLNDE